MDYNAMIQYYRNNPHDVPTKPTTGKKPVWFYVFEKNNVVYVDAAKNHTPSSRITACRAIQQSELVDMLSLYYRRQRGEAVSSEAVQKTRNQVYWYGIFADMKL